MADRYFCESPITGDQVVLTGPEAHHLVHVMRAGPGTRVVLFDGSGVEFPARVQRVGRSEIELAILGRQEVDRELPVSLTLGVALPKGDRQKWLVEKAVELGVARLVPLRTARSVAQPVRQALDRLRRTVVEASKQCGRNRLMEITPPRDWPDFVSESTESTESPCRLLAHPAFQEEPADASVHVSTREAVTTVGKVECPLFLAVGPEGGFTDEEVTLAVTAGWRPIDLGPRVLRVETAAVLLAAMVATARAG